VIVIDASALTKYILKEPEWEIIERYLVEDDVYSIDLIMKEVLNAIWKNTVIYKTIPIDISLEKYQLVKKIIDNEIIVLEYEEKYLYKAFKIAIDNNITIYDALYIAQAMDHKAGLLTSDKIQARTAKNLGIKVYLIT